MDIGITAAVAFGSALLGAIAGFSGSLYLANRTSTHRRNGAIVALLSELMLNNTRSISLVAKGNRGGAYSSSVWDGEAKFELANMVDGTVFSAFLQSYSLLEILDRAARRIEASKTEGDGDEEEAIRLGYEQTRTAFNMLLDQPGLPSVAKKWPRMESLDELVAIILAAMEEGPPA